MPLSQSARPEVSLVVPVYRCKGHIQHKIDVMVHYLKQRKETWEVIFVDDGSGDGTADLVHAHIRNLPGCRLVRLAKNVGKGGAVRRGMRAARGRYRMFTDCDLAYPITQVAPILRALKNGADAAIANRRDPDSLAEMPTRMLLQANRRERQGQIFNLVLRFFGLSTLPDTQAGLKGFRAETMPLFDYLTVTRFAFDIELLVIFQQHGKDVQAIPVRYRLDAEESTVRLRKDVPQMLASIVRVAINRARGRYLPSYEPRRSLAAATHSSQEHEGKVARI